MRRDCSVAAVIYTLLLCWPAIYRLTLPDTMGDIAYYIVAYVIPVMCFMLYLLQVRNAAAPFMLLLGMATVLIISIALADIRAISFSTIFHAVKFYLAPVMLVYCGVLLAGRLSRRQFQMLLVVIVAGHLAISLMHYFDLLPNPVYQANGQISENWSNVVGGYRAFVGLTLSKFDLAYQVGFLFVGAVLCSECFSSRRIRFLVMTIAALLVVFTYNKTIALVVLGSIFIAGYEWFRGYSKIGARTALAVVGSFIVGVFVRFLAGDFVLSDIFAFLSPQTFWSRVIMWQEVAVFDWTHIFGGIGAGSFAQQDITLDNQFLYGYLELGVAGACAYFLLFAAAILRLTGSHKFGTRLLVLLALTFVVGDILNAHALMFIIGLYLGQCGTEAVPVVVVNRVIQRSISNSGKTKPKHLGGLACE